jgi:hypothetical protein
MEKNDTLTLAEKKNPSPCSWTRRWDQPFAKHQEFTVRDFKSIISYLPLAWRAHRYKKDQEKQGKFPFFDPFQSDQNSGPILGVPIGGIGSGSINIGLTGSFTRFQIVNELPSPRWIPEDFFAIRISSETIEPIVKVLTKPPQGQSIPKCYRKWDWSLCDEKVAFHALYPNGWITYKVRFAIDLMK